MKNKTTYSIIIALCIIGFWIFENFYTPSNPSENEISGNTHFDMLFLPSSTTGEIVKHAYFVLSYNEPFEQPEWVAYELKKSHLTYQDRKRPYFIEDPKVKTKSADWRNYRGSGYDRGHLCPAGDRRFSEQAYNETFYTSNISPQHRDFNAGIWNQLEQKVRHWCKIYGDLIVVTGGILNEGLEQIGDEGVDVPKHFYKIVIRKNDNKAIAFILPHSESKKPLSQFLVSIDSIETLTGIDFFQKMTKTWQERVENDINSSDWKF